MKVTWRGNEYTLFERTTQRRSHPANPARWLTNIFGGAPSAAGVRVDEYTALQFPAFYAGVRVIAETVGTLGVMLYERDGENRARATSDPRYSLVHDVPNEIMTPMSFYETLSAHMILFGTAYVEIEYNGLDEPIGLWPIAPHRIRPIRRGRRLFFEVLSSGDGPAEILDSRRIMHIPGLGYDGTRGYGVVELHRNALGLGMAADEYAARLFGNGALPAGVLQFDGTFATPEDREDFRQQWNAQHQGAENANNVAILEMGMKWQSIAMSNQDAQFLETRKNQQTVCATMLRLPPHMIGDLEHATFSNIEHQAIEFVTYSILPWVRRIEQALNKALLMRSERGRLYFEALLDTLLRGDAQTRFEAYAKGRQNGWLSPNDIRRMENMNPIPEDQGGDTYLIPLNMIPAEQALAEASSDEGEGASDSSDILDFLEPTRAAIEMPVEERATTPAALRHRRRIQERHRVIFREPANEYVGLELEGLRRWLEQDNPTADQLAQFFADLRDASGDIFSGPCATYARAIFDAAMEEIDGEDDGGEALDTFCAQYVRSMLLRLTSGGQGQISTLLASAPLDESRALITERLDEWEQTRARKIVSREVVQAGGAFAKFAFRRNGVRRLIWRTSGRNCPLCNRLDGKIVGIDENFLAAGDEIDPQDGKTAPLRARNNVGHPQLHGGCDCMIAAQ